MPGRGDLYRRWNVTKGKQAAKDNQLAFAHAGLLAKSFTQACLYLFDHAGAEDRKRRAALGALLPFSLAWAIEKARTTQGRLPIDVHLREGSAQLRLRCHWVDSDPALLFLRSVSARYKTKRGQAIFTFTGGSLRRYEPPPGLIGEPLLG